MAYFTELELRIERSVRTTDGGADKVAMTQRVHFDPGQVQFGEDGGVFTVEEAADALRDIVLAKFEEWSPPKPAPVVRQREIRQAPEPEPEEQEEQEPPPKPSRNPFKRRGRE